MSETMGVVVIYSTQYFPNAKQKLFMHVMHITVDGKDDEFTCVICLCHRLRMFVAKFCEVVRDCPSYFLGSTFNTAIHFSVGKVIHFLPEISKLCTCICLLQHVGGTLEKASEIVCKNNGLSIAQWFEFCIGVSITSGHGHICC
jgi:hypothetical protein